MKIPINKFENWLVNKNLKARTVSEYLYYFVKFSPLGLLSYENMAKFLSKKSNQNSIARAFIRNYREFLISNHRELEISRDNLEELYELELPTVTGTTSIRLVKPLSKEEIELIVENLENEKHKVMTLLTFYCGLRLSELLRIRIMDFNWDEWKKDTSSMGECRVLGKGDKEGTALVPPFLMVRIAKYIRNKPRLNTIDSTIFMRTIETNRVRKRSLNISARGVDWRTALKKAGVKSGVTKLDSKGEMIEETKVWPHRLRHSAGSYYLNVVRLDMRKVQEILRHKHIGSTQRYTYIDKEDLKKQISKSLSF